jgi:two-component system NtrC family sensor kinase
MLLLYRTILLLVGGGGLLVAVLLLFILMLSWTNAERIRPLEAHLAFTDALSDVRTALAAAAGEEGPLQHRGTVDPGAALRELARDTTAMVPGTGDALQAAAAQLGPSGPASVVAGLESVIGQEAAARRALLDGLHEDNRREFQVVLALALVLPALTVALLLFFHRRVLAPVTDLSGFLALLARKDYALAPTDSVSPVVRPLYEKYNRMVKRMQDLEQGHRKREFSLREDVDQATRALLRQQAALSRVERMAAVGEVSARLGHELRNPLSGVLMALVNLREDVDLADQDERLGLAIAELERIAGMLTRVVDDSRLGPERARRLQLEGIVAEMVQLVRYQLNDEVTLETDVPEDLEVVLPETGLRHALLNLVLNAAQAIGDRPGTIRIGAERDGDALLLSVTDDGTGFPPALLDAGVNEFGTWRHGGTGLGLATVQRFAFALSGRLELTNLANGGARATLRLPAAGNA